MTESNETPVAPAREIPELPSDHPHLKWDDWFPGKAGVAARDGYHSGCAFKMFIATDDKEPDQLVNEWLAVNTGLLVVDIKFHFNAILIVYTKTLAPAEYDRMQRFTSKARELADEEEADRKAKLYEAEKASREAAAKAREEAAAAEKELKRLAELGKRHERNCKKEKQ